MMRSAGALALLYLGFLALHLAPEAVGTERASVEPEPPRRRLVPKLDDLRATLHPEMQGQPPSVQTEARPPPSDAPTPALRPPTASPKHAPTQASTPAPTLTEAHRTPRAALRGVPPLRRPQMTCNSTKGAFAVALDPSLCPRSVRQVAAMVQARFFTQGLSFWRVNEWITQFGADESPTARQVRILLYLNFHCLCLAIAACVC